MGKKQFRLKTVIRLLKYCAIAFVLFVLAIVIFLYFAIYLPQGSGPAGPDVPIEPFKTIWSQQQVLFLGIGDSITDGFGAPKGYSYFDRLIENPPGDSNDMEGKNLSVVFPNLKAQNIAVSCTVSSRHFQRIQKINPWPEDVLGVVVLTTGGNDIIHDYGRSAPEECAMYGATVEQAKGWIDNYRDRLDQMVLNIKGKFPGGCHIFLANIYDPSDGTGGTKYWLTGLPYWPDGIAILKIYNDIIAACAEKYGFVHLVNIHDAFLGHGIHCKKFWIKDYHFKDSNYWYYMNIEDPNPRGYDAIRRLFLLEMIKVFSGNGDEVKDES